MADYAITIMSKSANGWDVILTDEVELRAQKNPTGLRADVGEAYSELFDEADHMTEDMIERAMVHICNSIEDIDVEDSIANDVRSILRDNLNEDEFETDDFDLSSFVTVSIDVSHRSLLSEIEDNKECMDISFTAVLDAVGVIVYEVHDPDDVLVGKIVLNWLRD